MGIVIALTGALIAAAGVFDWNWFMNHRKARRLTNVIGRGASRGIYIVLGLGAVVTGVLMALGVVDLTDAGGSPK